MTKLPYLPEASALPGAFDSARAGPWLERWSAAADAASDPALGKLARFLAEDPAGQRLLQAIFANSPFLSHCLIADIGLLADVLKQGPRAVLKKTLEDLENTVAGLSVQQDLMKSLREARRRAAFCIAFADICGLWDVTEVTAALSDFADTAVDAALCGTLRQAAGRGELALADDARPSRGCGIAILGMGKLGAHELN
jgi:glutamate-ammonia-ligase adenylyltransferase